MKQISDYVVGVDLGATNIVSLLISRDGEVVARDTRETMGEKGKKITFIDTPGHEAFSQMRQRGALVSDLVVLVVAANDGVKPQTKESIKIIKEAKVPFIVAINKIDLPDASVDKIKAQLAENEVYVEGYGGDTVVVPVSAKTGQGVDQLLEMIILSSEMESLQADPQAELKAVVVESKFDKLCGSTRL